MPIRSTARSRGNKRQRLFTGQRLERQALARREKVLDLDVVALKREANTLLRELVDFPLGLASGRPAGNIG
jgi:hypothetical protein